MRWPWQSAPVEHRSSIADQVVTAILQSASGGGGVRPALATAALESAASLYASALAACEVRGPSSVTRAIDASWRASVAASLIRRGQALFTIGADPASGLTLTPASSWDVHGGPWPASWYYRVQLAGPSGTAWETHTAASLLHLRWQVDPARPWAGVSPLQRARDTAGIASWLEKRLAEEASSPVGSFLPVARYDADPDDDLDGDDADDPLAQLRADIGAARRVSRHRVGVRDSARVTRRECQRASGARSVAAVDLDIGGRTRTAARSAATRTASRLLKNSAKWDRQIDPVVLRCSQH